MPRSPRCRPCPKPTVAGTPTGSSSCARCSTGTIRPPPSSATAKTAQRVQDLTGRARTGKLEPREVQGGTFTISNHGVSGSLLAAPIVINQPQSAILGVGKLEPRARVSAAGAIEARPMLYVTLTIDHRVLDGFQANVFLSKWVEVIEQWT